MDELIKRLREAAEYVPCIMDREDAIKAADAIEELLSERGEVNADSWKTAFEVERDEHRWIPVTEKLPEEKGYYRGYQKGDLVKFHVINRKNVVEPLDDKVYEITYVLSGWRIEAGYVVFGIKEVTDD